MSAIPKGFWALLAASIAINLFGAGLIAGRVLSPRQRPSHGEEDIGPRAFLKHSGLREAGPEVKQILKQRRDQVKESMRALSHARDEVRVALQAEPYNADRASQAFARTRELTSEMQADMHTALLDVSSKLTPAQRKRMAESLWNHRGGKH